MLTASLKPLSSCPFCCNIVQHVTTGAGQTAQICCLEKGYWRAQYAAGQSRQPKGLHTGSPADSAASACAAEVQRRVPDTERSGCAQCCKGCCSQRGSLRLHHRLHGTLGAQQSDQEEGKHTTRLRVMLSQPAGRLQSSTALSGLPAGAQPCCSAIPAPSGQLNGLHRSRSLACRPAPGTQICCQCTFRAAHCLVRSTHR